MQIIPYLFFNGNARQAATAYAAFFNVPLPEMLTMHDAPKGMVIPDERRDWVMHCEMRVGTGTIMLSDDFVGNSPAMAGSSVMVSLPTAAEGQTVFEQLAEGGEVRMPWEPSFWSAGFGALTDRFGIRWMVGTDEPPAEG